MIQPLIWLALLAGWRALALHLSRRHKKRPAVLAGRGGELRELADQVNGNPRHPLKIVALIDDRGQPGRADVAARIHNCARAQGAGVVILDLAEARNRPWLARLAGPGSPELRFLDFDRLYEEAFARIPLARVSPDWLADHVSKSPRLAYGALKRLMDVSLGGCLGLVSLAFYPFVCLAIKIEDGGPVFVAQARVGLKDKPFRLYKFRSMAFNDAGDQVRAKSNRVTLVGRFIRKTRIDELPQLWNVLKADLSLIGPRPELPALVEAYEKEIPFYKVRRLVKPGLSGWAQLHHQDPPKVVADIERTRVKLAYDLYYIKRRSFALDLLIALKTIKVVAQRNGR